jgi:hypothetical protein
MSKEVERGTGEVFGETELKHGLLGTQLAKGFVQAAAFFGVSGIDVFEQGEQALLHEFQTLDCVLRDDGVVGGGLCGRRV